MGSESSPKQASRTPKWEMGVLKHALERQPWKCMNSVLDGSKRKPTDLSHAEARSYNLVVRVAEWRKVAPEAMMQLSST